jgi:hypothetical protein
MACSKTINHDENAVIGDDAANQGAEDRSDSIDVSSRRRVQSMDQKLHPDMFVFSDEPGSGQQSQEQETVLGALQGALYRFIEEIPHHDIATDQQGHQTKNDPRNKCRAVNRTIEESVTSIDEPGRIH